ncbi:hypothetical protein CASFOL_009738 [Castilleja foliolosa]|uniref:Uncharacterized protein n=1 Tax=Castilleja foliolosa TaxID=1961234 RepID=A0ABD3DQI3_9LAMI
MAENQQKRLRSEDDNLEFDDSLSNSKRPKPYNNILSLLDEDDECEEQNQDLSAIFKTLEREITSSEDAFDFESQSEDDRKADVIVDGDEGVESVMRHLLEASDDELGIPSTEDYNNFNFDEIRSNDDYEFANFVDIGLWELEDVAANYYTVLQSELFM